VSSSDKPAVLVVEDEALTLLAAVDLVESAGFEALEARNADEAIAILEARTDVRLVFTDVDMPGTMDGLKLSHFIRDRWPPIRIIVASGKAILDESHLPAGARFFSKPYGDQTIVAALIEMLA
jgi:two-component system, response regulator PdtaR